MFRVVLYVILGGLIGFFAAVALGLMLYPPVNDGLTHADASIYLLWGAVVICALGGYFLALSRNRLDQKPNSLQWSKKLPPHSAAVVVIAIWMQIIGLLAGIFAAGLDQAQHIGVFAMNLVGTCGLMIGGAAGVWNVRRMGLKFPKMSVDMIALAACFLLILTNIVSGPRIFISSPMNLFWLGLTLLPAYLVVRFNLKKR